MKKHQSAKSTERVKLVPKFKILDAVIILLIITSVLGIYFRYNVMDTLKNQKDMKEYVISFSVQNIRSSTTNYINVGDDIYFSEDGEKLGELMSHMDDSNDPLLSEIASEYFVNENGTIVPGYYPESDSMDARINVSGRISCMGSYSEDGGFLVNGTKYLAPGQTVQVQTELVTVTLVIQDITLREITK